MSSAYYVAIIDGTGPYSDQQYSRDFEFSFLHQLAKALGRTRCSYFPGPGTIGLTTRSKANLAVEALHTRREQNRACKLFIAGYSRGGAAAMEVAKMCAYYRADPEDYRIVPETIPIEGLFLLDPVSKDVFCTGGGITQNVKTTYVMYRDKKIWEYSPVLKTEDFESYTDKTLAVGFNAVGKNDPDRYARKFMENAYPTMETGNSRTRLVDYGAISGASHGAIGGMPWVERWEDQEPCEKAASVFSAWLGANGINVRVRDKSYTEANKKAYPRVTEAETRARLVREAQEAVERAKPLRRGRDW
jgi:hypothetical protein